jgi:LmbE family N-acetylglucosaminyl deacetylase
VVTSGVGAVSPHLDDVALSCAGLLAAHPGSSMVTAFAGGPGSVDPVTEWEELSGIFGPGADIVGARRQEDVEASSELGSTFHHLDHWDHQYRTPTYGYRGPTARADLVQAVAQDLEVLIDASAPTTWAIPLGLSHPDHQLAAEACLDIVARLSDIEWLVYEELPYAVYLPETVLEATANLASRGFDLRPAEGIELAPDTVAKRRAVDCYRSQLRPLGPAVDAALDAPERIYRLVPTPSR